MISSTNIYKRLNRELVQKNKELKEEVAVLKTEIVRLQKTCQDERELAIQEKLKFVETLTDSFNSILRNAAVSASSNKPQFVIQKVMKRFPEISENNFPPTKRRKCQTPEASSGYGRSDCDGVESTSDDIPDSFPSPSSSRDVPEATDLLSGSSRSVNVPKTPIISLDFDTILEETSSEICETLINESMERRSEMFETFFQMKEVPASTPLKDRNQKRKCEPVIKLKLMSKQAVLNEIRRPKRAASPSNLAETNLKKKLRRENVGNEKSRELKKKAKPYKKGF